MPGICSPASPTAAMGTARRSIRTRCGANAAGTGTDAALPAIRYEHGFYTWIRIKNIYSNFVNNKVNHLSTILFKIEQ